MTEEKEPTGKPEEPGPPPAAPETAESPGPQAGNKKDKKKDKEGSWVRENIEAIIVAIVLALIIREFAMEAFVIPTGSMAPTLFGEHTEITCPNCSRRFAIDNPNKSPSFEKAYRCSAECPRCKSRGTVYLYANEYSESSEAVCQNCGNRWIVETPESGRTVMAKRIALICPNCDFEFKRDITPSDVTGGHKILVNKAGLLVRDPKRWDVIVFKYPEDTTKNYIKRLIGLPGEKLQAKDGDIYINGKIARKELDVIRAMKFEVFNSELDQKWEKTIPWTSFDDNWQLAVESLEVKAHEGESAAEFNKRITSSLPYSDPDGDSSYEDVTDIGYKLSVTCRDKGEFFCTIDNQEYEFRFTVPVGDKGSASLTKDGVKVRTADLRFEPGKTYDVEFLAIDDRVLGLVEGREVFRYDYEPDRIVSGSAQISLGTVKSAARFDKVHVYRDIYYVPQGEYGVREALELGPDEYFAMGDNSASSKDSRGWGTVPAPNMLGRGFIIFWPITQIKFIK